MNRVLAWEGCLNARDLGAVPGIRSGVVVRADSIRGLTEAGRRALLDYGVRTVIDLRGEEECADDPPLPEGLIHVRAPMPPRQNPTVWEFPTMLESYLAMLETFRPQFAQAADAVAQAEPVIVVHCAGGRDRTGLLVAMLLRVVGVDVEEIAADHALSDEIYAPTLDEWLAEAPDKTERDRRWRISRPAGRTMADVFAEVERSYGGVEAYLQIDAKTVARLRELLCEQT